MAKGKKEALSVSRLISEVLIDQLGIPVKQIVNDTSFSKYTSIMRPDILISNAEYDLVADNQDEYIKNLVCYVEAKSISCKVDDADWKDGISHGIRKAPMLGIPFFGVTNCKTTYFYNASTGDKLTINGNIISEFQTLDIFRIIKKTLENDTTSSDIKIGSGALTSVSEAVFNKKLWELANEYRAIDFENNTQKIDFTIGMIALEYYEEKSIIDSTHNAALTYWSDGRTAANEKELVSRITSYVDWLSMSPDFAEFSSLIKKVKMLINGTRPVVNASSFSSIYSIIDSMYPLHGTGFDLFGAVYECFANSKEKKDFGEYFTRRQYAHVFAELLLREEKVYNHKNQISIIDPFCGTGGMLTESFKVLREHYKDSGSYSSSAEKHLAERCFFGIDIRNENISRTRLNMFLVGDGHTNMHADNSLVPETQIGKAVIHNEYKYCITNPPYGAGTITAATDVVGSKRMEVAALYRVLDLLETGGRACIITPDGILENPTLCKVRDEILRTCEIEAIVSLPKFAFAPYTKEKTYALFFKKLYDRTTAPKDNKVLPTGKYQKSKIWMYIIDNDGFANSDKRFPTRLRKENEEWLHDELQGYVDDAGNENLSILEQRWKSFDDAPDGTSWISEKGEHLKMRKGGFISIKDISDDKYKTLLPEYYLRPYNSVYMDLDEMEMALSEVKELIHELNEWGDEK